MIINAGMSYLVPDMLRQLELFGIDETRIKRLLILHAHFDHVGIAPFFKRRHPELEICASARAWEILHKPKAIGTINEFSLDVAKRMGRENVYAAYDLDWRDDIGGTVVSEGDCIDLGDLQMHFYETPGHSSCSISAYVPKIRTLFASDAGGIPYKEMIIAFGNSNFTKFQQSLEKLKDLAVDFVCADHYGCVTGDEAGDFIRRCIASAKQQRTLLEKAYHRTHDIEIASQELADAFYKENPEYFLAPEITKGIYQQMVRHIADPK
jgi:glyoxylase-like metal-dependent hydrolase (beta-lactamase superfamily II)